MIARAEAAGDDCVIVLDDRRRPRAWPWLRELRTTATITDPGDDRVSTVDRRATLNDALDSMLTDSHSAVIVTGRRDEYQGVIDFRAVTGHIAAAGVQAASDSGAASGEAAV